ncbi:MAG: hypothetical protein HC796_04545 [Synechococcaceae cyanobacterium RL_1_2]|nr:hypothetical protein [Synechococcaceae cyanobacterium RL_1_2]
MDNSVSSSNFKEPLISRLEYLEDRFTNLLQALERRQLDITAQDFTLAHRVYGANDPVFRCLKIGVKDLVQYFHDCPQLLEPYAIATDLGEATYRDRTDKVILDCQRGQRGKFWVLFLENDQGKKFYIAVPNGNLSYKLSRVKNTLQKLFDIKVSNAGSEEITLLLPAQLQLRSDYQSWELIPEQKGKLEQGGSSFSPTEIKLELERLLNAQTITKTELHQEIQNLSQAQEKTKAYLSSLEKYLASLKDDAGVAETKATLATLKNNVNNLDRRLQQLQSAQVDYFAQLKLLQQQVPQPGNSDHQGPSDRPTINYDGIQQTFRNLHDRVGKLEQNFLTIQETLQRGIEAAPAQPQFSDHRQDERLDHLEQRVQKISEVVKQLGETTLMKSRLEKGTTPLPAIAPHSEESLSPLAKLVRLYNHNPNQLKQNYQLWIVKETQESIRRRFDNQAKANATDVIFEQTDNGIYWLLKDGAQYYLTLYNLDNLDLTNNFVKKTVQLLFECRRNYGHSKAQLIKPASVTRIASEPPQWKLTSTGILEFTA